MRARILYQMGHAVSVIHLLSAARVVTGMTGENSLHFVRFMVVPRHLAHTACYLCLAHLTIPILIGATANQHFICQNTEKLILKLRNN